MHKKGTTVRHRGARLLWLIGKQDVNVHGYLLRMVISDTWLFLTHSYL